MGTTCTAGMGTVWEIPTHGIPMPNPRMNGEKVQSGPDCVRGKWFVMGL